MGCATRDGQVRLPPKGSTSMEVPRGQAVTQSNRSKSAAYTLTRYGCSRTSASLTTRSECPTRRLINVRKPISGRSVTAKSSVSPPNPRGIKRVKLSFNQSQSSWAPKPALAPDNLRADPDQKSTSVALTPEHKTQKVEFQGPRVPLKAPPGINLPSDGVPTLASP